MKKIAITGHRPNKLGNDYELTSKLMLGIKAKLVSILEQEIKTHKEILLITGMALGIDTLFALIAIEMRLPFIAAVPCYNQDSKWRRKSQRLYADLLNNPLSCLKFIHEGEYTNTCMQERNEWMVNECDLLIAVWDGSAGGTGNCVKYAMNQCKDIITINPKLITT
jgi:uncharacterized phage-like protein YoqJ